jgi:hypothetical protein
MKIYEFIISAIIIALVIGMGYYIIIPIEWRMINAFCAYHNNTGIHTSDGYSVNCSIAINPPPWGSDWK